MAPNDSTAAAGPTNAGLTRHRFGFDSGSRELGLIDLGMSLATAELPADPDALARLRAGLPGELKAAEMAVQIKALEIEKLKFQIAKLRRMQFGRSSERITRQIEQLELRLEELETGEAEDTAQAEAESQSAPQPIRERSQAKAQAAAGPSAAPGGRASARRRWRLHLPRLRRGMAKLGEDVTEVLDYVPGHFQVIRHVRPKYACTACDAITQAPAPAMPTPRGRATPAMLAHLLVSKYCDHLPLYRQSEIYAREGLELDRSTLCDWVGQAAWLLDPVVAAIRRHVFAAEKIHGDDTTVPVLAPGLGRTKTGRLWVYVRDDRPFCGHGPAGRRLFLQPRPRRRASGGAPGELHRLAPGRRLCRVRGALRSARRGPSPARSPKWRAGRIAAASSSTSGKRTKSPVAKEALDRIAAIYAIEDKARFAPAAERVAHRAETAPLLDAFFAWAEKTVAKLSAKSELAEAFRYTIKRRDALSRFVTDGRLEVDNNIAENAMRGIALGRKNYLFAGSDAGGERAAAIYTIVQTAKLNGLNPETYLKDMLAKIADGHPINRIDELMPWKHPPVESAVPNPVST